LVLSVHPEDQYAVRALRSGAAGYLTKDHSPEQLVDAIRKVHRGGKYVSPTLAERLATDLATAGARHPRHELLSHREYEVLCLLGSGRTVKEISEELRLSPKTISTYRARVLEKTVSDLMDWHEDSPPPGEPAGGATALAPAGVNYLTADFAAGNYVLLCFVPDAADGRPHLAHGMLSEFRVD
jgi:DNA-binding CsgD family transcriptional regulator